MTRLVCLFHGSRDPRWRAPLEALVQRLAAELGEERVCFAYLDHAPPDLATVVRQAARERVERLLVWPLFVSSGGHVEHDVPQKLAEAQAEVPGVALVLLPALGEHPAFATLLATLAKELLEKA